MSGKRTPVDLRIGNRARRAHAAVTRWEQRAAEATEQADVARQELAVIHRTMCDRFGRAIPADAFLLDVLELIDITDGDRWEWRGGRNNKGLAVVRRIPGSPSAASETSVVRYLAIEFGVIDADDHGVLYPIDGDIEDVNPWHRKLRRSERPAGNPNRFKFQPLEAVGS